MQQIIIHVDMDAFFASVEMRDHPELRGKPLIIGALPHERGVVATCSYEARRFGVHSAMNIKEAYRCCPQGIYMHPDFYKYKAVSEQLHAIWNTYASAAQTIALDEAYLDVTAAAKDWDGARRIARIIKQRTWDELGLTCSVGVAYSKTAAKTASEENKPNGYFEILTAEDFVRLIIDRDVRVLYTVGAKTAEKLRSAGIRTVRDIQERPADVIRLCGRHGQWLVQLASGRDERAVTPYRPEDAKSIGREVTFQQDVSDHAVLRDVLILLAFCVEHRAKRVGLRGRGITLKLTYSDMKQITRSHLIPQTDSAVTIYQETVRLLEQLPQRPVRLIGAGLYQLSAEPEERQLSFDDQTDDAPHSEETARRLLLDGLRTRYGLDFAGNLEKIYNYEVLHKTVEYLRQHRTKPIQD